MASEGEAKMARLETTVAKLEELVRGLAAWKASAEATRQRDVVTSTMTTFRTAAPSDGGAARFGNYGRSKGQPVAGATADDLRYYGDGCRRTLGDPSKSNFHARETALLAAIEAELARQGNGGAPPHDDSDAPPQGDIPF